MFDLMHRSPGPRLSQDEERALLTIVQSAPSTVVIHDDGTATRTYTQTPEAEAAWLRLVDAYLQGIHGATIPSIRKAHVDEEDAFGIALAEFTATAREIDLDDDVPFIRLVIVRMKRAVMRAAQTAAVVTVPDTAFLTYHRIMHAASHDRKVAYEMVKAGGYEMAPTTFLAVDRALYVDSIEGAQNPDGVVSASAFPSTDPGPDVSMVQHDLVAWLLSQVTPLQRSVLRALYGFEDADTSAVLEGIGLQPGTVLSDGQVSAALGISRQKAQREKGKALATMREAIEREMQNA